LKTNLASSWYGWKITYIVWNNSYDNVTVSYIDLPNCHTIINCLSNWFAMLTNVLQYVYLFGKCRFTMFFCWFAIVIAIQLKTNMTIPRSELYSIRWSNGDYLPISSCMCDSMWDIAYVYCGPTGTYSHVHVWWHYNHQQWHHFSHPLDSPPQYWHIIPLGWHHVPMWERPWVQWECEVPLCCRTGSGGPIGPGPHGHLLDKEAM
jgi:hypothetical protein